MTRLLLAGATSHIANTLLPLLLSSPFISHIVLLSRHSIRSATLLANDKITQILHDPSASTPPFPDDLIAKLRDVHRVQAVVWCIGGALGRFKTFDEAQDANVSLPLRFLEGCLEGGLVRTPAGLTGNSEGDGEGEEEKAKGKGRRQRYIDPESKRQPFRFVYFSTYNAVQDQFASLWGEAKFRRLKGAAEKALLGLAEEKGQGMCEVYCLRIGRVLEGQTVGNVVRMGMGGCITDELLGRKVLSLCLGGRGDEKYGEKTGGGVLENEEVMGEGWAEINSVTING
ncbi:hypothetical protein C1H76_1818 [Elsinoe australis]|uniref:NAD(P)-binding domain-containing protein n=1 Tax=Elsinoe australis TaxID=40998 RepID=A0A4V6DV27_9PEZI|nr:hypothetical protein C1H76_1818 [Elsinoe australis]